ncbi:MAG: hypothetical protein UV73_C0003G0130 [Candidatus Gottesmanbacteria bacterium GW2011_GWA2_43_14]|uniref:Uncharacterized protein n=1 Tax=Candidatus Gottesmanbacteria bacterium GW2011_GWA2_43_14 TaxID=1618443 RepID=A0A0G1GHC4_9BACT|nr:MAG: hypothetical protein UV73_C0003G0130 [Candidatus Gottesmanbacteria bacterium GW2011_GWA2_43_14]
MKTKIPLYVLIGLIFLVISGGTYVSVRGRMTKPEKPPIAANPIPSPVETADWEDQSEFKFSYPKNLKLNPHDEDTENYANLELSKSNHPGSIVLWTKDTRASDIKEWLIKEKIANVIETELDGYPAVKVLSQGESKKLTVSAIRSGYLYQIEANLTDEKYWQPVFDSVLASYKFLDTEKTQIVPKDSGGGQTEIIYEAEEVIE